MDADMKVTNMYLFKANEAKMTFQAGVLSLCLYPETIDYFYERLKQVCKGEEFFPAEIIDVEYLDDEVSIYGVLLAPA